MQEGIYKVYTHINEKQLIDGIESTAFFPEADLESRGYIHIDDGYDNAVYGHAQANYLEMKYSQPMYDDVLQNNYIYENEEIRRLTEEEKQKFFPPIDPELSEQERFNAAVLLELAKLKAGDAV